MPRPRRSRSCRLRGRSSRPWPSGLTAEVVLIKPLTLLLTAPRWRGADELRGEAPPAQVFDAQGDGAP